MARNRGEFSEQEGEAVPVLHTTQDQKARPTVPPGCVLVKMKETGRLEVRSRQTASELIKRGSAEDVGPEGKV